MSFHLNIRERMLTPPFCEERNNEYYEKLLDDERSSKLLSYTLEQVSTYKEVSDFFRSADLDSEFEEIFGRKLDLDVSVLSSPKRYSAYSIQELESMNTETKLFLYILDRYWKIVEKRRDDYGIKLIFSMPKKLYYKKYKEVFGMFPDEYKRKKRKKKREEKARAEREVLESSASLVFAKENLRVIKNDAK